MNPDETTAVHFKTFPTELNRQLKVIAALEGTTKQQLIYDILREFADKKLNN